MNAPEVNEAVALAAELCRHFEGFRSRPYICPAGYPTIGFANAWMYAAAAAETPPFYDITRGINSVQLVGCCTAYPGYDMASGLGAPQMDALYATLPRPAG